MGKYHQRSIPLPTCMYPSHDFIVIPSLWGTGLLILCLTASILYVRSCKCSRACPSRATIHRAARTSARCRSSGKAGSGARSEPRDLRLRLFDLLIRVRRYTVLYTGLSHSHTDIADSRHSIIHHTTNPRQASLNNSSSPHHSTDSTRVSEAEGSSAQDAIVHLANWDRIRTATRIE